jgi:hypothetical protein
VQRFILGVDQEPPPPIGPEGSSTDEAKHEAMLDVRPEALPVVVASPAPPLPEWPEAGDVAVGIGASCVPEATTCTEGHRPEKTLEVLTAVGVMLGWRWREEEEERE